MLESQLAGLLEQLLDDWFEGISKEAVSLSVWSGTCELEGLNLRPGPICGLEQLPFEVVRGQVGTLRITADWRDLWSSKPVRIELGDVFVLLRPAEWQQFGCRARAVRRKMSQVNKELYLERKGLARGKMPLAENADKTISQMRAERKAEKEHSWGRWLAGKALEKVELRVSSLHVRLEDRTVSPVPAAAGLFLSVLDVSSERPDSESEQRFCKRLLVEDCGVYCDSDQVEWLEPLEWLNAPDQFGQNMVRLMSRNARERFVLPASSIEGSYKYEPGRHHLQVTMERVALSARREQLWVLLAHLERITLFERWAKFRVFWERDQRPASGAEWWRYAKACALSVVRQASGSRLDPASLSRRRRCRRQYTQLYQAARFNEDRNAQRALEALQLELPLREIMAFESLAYRTLQRKLLAVDDYQSQLNIFDPRRHFDALLAQDVTALELSPEQERQVQAMMASDLSAVANSLGDVFLVDGTCELVSVSLYDVDAQGKQHSWARAASFEHKLQLEYGPARSRIAYSANGAEVLHSPKVDCGVPLFVLSCSGHSEAEQASSSFQLEIDAPSSIHSQGSLRFVGHQRLCVTLDQAFVRRLMGFLDISHLDLQLFESVMYSGLRQVRRYTTQQARRIEREAHFWSIDISFMAPLLALPSGSGSRAEASASVNRAPSIDDRWSTDAVSPPDRPSQSGLILDLGKCCFKSESKVFDLETSPNVHECGTQKIYCIIEGVRGIATSTEYQHCFGSESARAEHEVLRLTLHGEVKRTVVSIVERADLALDYVASAAFVTLDKAQFETICAIAAEFIELYEDLEVAYRRSLLCKYPYKGLHSDKLSIDLLTRVHSNLEAASPQLAPKELATLVTCQLGIEHAEFVLRGGVASSDVLLKCMLNAGLEMNNSERKWVTTATIWSLKVVSGASVAPASITGFEQPIVSFESGLDQRWSIDAISPAGCDIVSIDQRRRLLSPTASPVTSASRGPSLSARIVMASDVRVSIVAIGLRICISEACLRVFKELTGWLKPVLKSTAGSDRSSPLAILCQLAIDDLGVQIHTAAGHLGKLSVPVASGTLELQDGVHLSSQCDLKLSLTTSEPQHLVRNHLAWDIDEASADAFAEIKVKGLRTELSLVSPCQKLHTEVHARSIVYTDLASPTTAILSCEAQAGVPGVRLTIEPDDMQCDLCPVSCVWQPASLDALVIWSKNIYGAFAPVFLTETSSSFSARISVVRVDAKLCKKRGSPALMSLSISVPQAMVVVSELSRLSLQITTPLAELIVHDLKRADLESVLKVKQAKFQYAEREIGDFAVLGVSDAEMVVCTESALDGIKAIDTDIIDLILAHKSKSETDFKLTIRAQGASILLQHATLNQRNCAASAHCRILQLDMADVDDTMKWSVWTSGCCVLNCWSCLATIRRSTLSFQDINFKRQLTLGDKLQFVQMGLSGALHLSFLPTAILAAYSTWHKHEAQNVVAVLALSAMILLAAHWSSRSLVLPATVHATSSSIADNRRSFRRSSVLSILSSIAIAAMHVASLESDGDKTYVASAMGLFILIFQVLSVFDVSLVSDVLGPVRTAYQIP